MESPYLGWIVPYSWQESCFSGDPDDSEPEIDDDVDDEGYLIITN